MKKPELPPMKIIKFTAENVKRLVAVSITPDGNLVQITGRNGQGKTSVLDAIWWGLAGAKNIQAQPIRRGQQRATIELDLGPIVVTRTFTRKGENDYTTQIVVESADRMSVYNSPQEVINATLGAMSFDPMRFLSLKPREQFDLMRQFVPGIDFDLVDGQNLKEFNRRALVKKLAQEAAAAASMIAVPSDTPEEEIDKPALMSKLDQAHRTNREITERQEARKQATEWLVGARAQLANLEQDILNCVEQSERFRDESIASYQRQIDELQKAIERSRTLCREAIEHESAKLREQGADLQRRVESMTTRLANAEPLQMIDTDAIVAEINKADVINKNVARAAERATHLRTAERYQKEADELSASITARTKAKENAIAAAELPVKGLSFGEGIVLLDKLPFDQAADADQLRTSVAIAMKTNPTLRVIRIRDGEKLDSASLQLLAKMADEHDFQLWIERVDETGNVGFVLEDGHARKAEETELTLESNSG